MGNSTFTFANFTYTRDDKVKTIQYGNGLDTTYTYNSRSRPTRILVKNGATTTMDLNYTYTNNGNVQNINTESYSYDGLDRLISTSGPWGSITYTYDAVGNRLTKTEGSTTSYTYGSYNRLTSSSTPNINYTYDNNGNMITKNDGSSWSYSYDYSNMLTKVVKGSDVLGQYYYDGEGKRVKVTENGATRVSIQLGLSLIYEKNTGSGSQAKYISANGLQIARINGTNVLDYFYSDALGSTRKTINHIQFEQFSSNYKPFGPQYGATGSEKVKYTGKWEDSPTKLYYFGARYYDAELGRFISQDPIPSINQYAYANNNPLRFVDPLGLNAMDLDLTEEQWAQVNAQVIAGYEAQAAAYQAKIEHYENEIRLALMQIGATPILSDTPTATAPVSSASVSISPVVQAIANEPQKIPTASLADPGITTPGERAAISQSSPQQTYRPPDRILGPVREPNALLKHCREIPLLCLDVVWAYALKEIIEVVGEAHGAFLESLPDTQQKVLGVIFIAGGVGFIAVAAVFTGPGAAAAAVASAPMIGYGFYLLGEPLTKKG
jgi:RHS repeat-associated protein